MIDNRKKYAPGKPGHKFYLSTEARSLLEAESRRTTYPMSVIVDLLIKKHLPGCAPEAVPSPARPAKRIRPDG